MSRAEISLIMIPLLLLVGVLCIIELRTGLIPDVVLIPAAAYFIVLGSLVGQKPWWHYPLGIVSLLILFWAIAEVYVQIRGVESFGGGAIKLLAVVGGALGILMALQVAAVFIVLMIMSLVLVSFFSNNPVLPSSPLTLLSILIVLGYHFSRAFTNIE